MSGRKALLKSLITSCFIDIDLAIYMMRAIEAISEVWKLRQQQGNRNHKQDRSQFRVDGIMRIITEIRQEQSDHGNHHVLDEVNFCMATIVLEGNRSGGAIHCKNRSQT